RFVVDTGEQMPKREPIAYVRLAKHDFKLSPALKSFLQRVHLLECGLKLRGGILKERSARTCPGGTAKCSGWNDRFAGAAFQRDEAERHMQQAAAIVLDLERVFATQIDGRRGWRFHDEQSWWRPGGCFELAAIKRDPVLISLRHEKANSRIRI